MVRIGSLGGKNRHIRIVGDSAVHAEPSTPIDDISRFARDIRGHWLLREQLREAGGFLESPRIKSADDADSIFNENILVSVAQHQRQKNAEQTKSRMRGRILNGYWPFNPCVGFKHVR